MLSTAKQALLFLPTIYTILELPLLAVVPTTVYLQIPHIRKVDVVFSKYKLSGIPRGPKGAAYKVLQFIRVGQTDTAIYFLKSCQLYDDNSG